MKVTIVNMVWPAIYVMGTFYKFWFLVIGTVVLETFIVKYFLKFSWLKSIIISLVGNCVSGLIGTFVMMWAMLGWHMLADRFVPDATFDHINWVATYILMCLGSVFLETLAIKVIYKERIKSLFLPMLTGNLLSYAFIAFVMISATDKDPDEVRTEELKYLPDQQQFILLDSGKLQIDTCTIKVSYDKDNQRINDTKSQGYSLHIPFKKEKEESFQFEFKILGEENGGGIGENSKSFYFPDLRNEYKIVIEQKNPDKSFGWTKPIITDTLTLRRVK